MDYNEIANLDDAELDEFFRAWWPLIREQVWLSLPRPMRWVPFKPG
jgi:hypothetical protein